MTHENDLHRVLEGGDTEVDNSEIKIRKNQEEATTKEAKIEHDTTLEALKN